MYTRLIFYMLDYSYNKSQRDALFFKFIFYKEFFFIKNKFEKCCISLAFIIRKYHDARSSECQKVGLCLLEKNKHRHFALSLSE